MEPGPIQVCQGSRWKGPWHTITKLHGKVNVRISLDGVYLVKRGDMQNCLVKFNSPLKLDLVDGIFVLGCTEWSSHPRRLSMVVFL